MQCLICRGEARYWRDVEGTPAYRCVAADCGFGFFDLDGWRAPDGALDYYREGLPERINPAAPFIKARVAILRRFKTAGRVAELGCGVGETAIALHEAGFSVVGVEDSAAAITLLAGRYPAIDWRRQNLVEFLAGERQSLDALTMFHVLEHLPQPEQAIGLANQALREGGVIVIEVPDVGGGLARWSERRWGYFVDHHVNYFDLKSLQKLMASFGFRRRFLERTYHFGFPQGHFLKDIAKKALATIGLNSIIRTAWTK